MVVNRLAHKILLRLPAETAHDIGKWGMRRRLFAPGRFISDSKNNLFGIEVDNPLGIAAGFDKYAVLQETAREYGFGWIEEGSFTYNGGEGNKKPRLFRLREEKGLLNRMGLNGISSAEAAEILAKANQKSFAVNIAKTHNPDIVGDKAFADVIGSYNLLKNLGIYTVLNLSCPNT